MACLLGLPTPPTSFALNISSLGCSSVSFEISFVVKQAIMGKVFSEFYDLFNKMMEPRRGCGNVE